MEVLWTFMVGMITSDKVKKRIPDRFPNLTFAFDKRRVFLLFDNLPTGSYNEIQDITASL